VDEWAAHYAPAAVTHATPRPRVPIHADLLTAPLTDLGDIRLVGSACQACREVSFGRRAVCPNCGYDAVTEIALGTRGVLWTYTVVRHRPPGNYRGPEPFEPFGLGLVELPEGVRVLAPIQCGIDRLAIGLDLRFKAFIRDDPDREVVVFAFEPAEDGSHV
jgi:uncharacterized OB-fold protein